MIRPLAFLVAITAACTFALHGAFSTYHPFVLASPETRKSVEVTTAQNLELRAAELASDMIAYAVFSALLCGALAACCSAARSAKGQIVGLVVGLLGGAVAGAATGWIGHSLELNPTFAISDPMIYAIVRWSLMLLPIGIMAGIALSASDSAGKIANTVAGAVIGAILASMIYSIAVGTFTTIEARSAILPFHDANRMMLIGLSVFCIGAGAIIQLHRKLK